MEVSKRDYFAAQALTGLLARAPVSNQRQDVYFAVAAEAFQYADAMLRLSKTLLDPVEIDPDQLSRETEPPLKEKSDSAPPQ